MEPGPPVNVTVPPAHTVVGVTLAVVTGKALTVKATAFEVVVGLAPQTQVQTTS